MWKDFKLLYDLVGHQQSVWAVLAIDAGQFLTGPSFAPPSSRAPLTLRAPARCVCQAPRTTRSSCGSSTRTCGPTPAIPKRCAVSP